jgi:arsenite methyltransferase
MQGVDFSTASGGGCPLLLAPPPMGGTVVDLGCGPGHDTVIAARMVGPRGLVVGVDFTPAMLGRARETAVRCGMQGRICFVEAVIDAPGSAETINNAVAAAGSRPYNAGDGSGDGRGAAGAAGAGAAAGGNHRTTVISADVVVSNGVINLCSDKRAAFELAHTLTRPGGVFALSDVCREASPAACAGSGTK